MSNFVAHQRASMVGGLLVAVVSTALVRGLPALGGIRSTQWRQRSSIAAMVISDSSAGSQPKSISPEELLQLEAITKRGMSEMNKKRSRSTWRSARGQRGETLRRLRHSSSDRAAVARTIGELKPLQNPKEYSIAIDAMAKVRDGRGATALLDEMLSRHDVADPDVVCFSAAIRACGRAGQWRRALSVMADMERRGVAPNSHTFSAAISACAQGGHWQPALALLERMPLLGVPPNLYCFNSAIAACEKGAEWQRALELLERMELQGVRPDAFSFNSAISACEKGGRWDRALALLYLMERRGVLPDVISYSAAISACGKGGRWERALALMKAMQRRQIAPNLHSFNAAISACGAAGQPGPAVRRLRPVPLLLLVPLVLSGCVGFLVIPPLSFAAEHPLPLGLPCPLIHTSVPPTPLPSPSPPLPLSFTGAPLGTARARGLPRSRRGLVQRYPRRARLPRPAARARARSCPVEARRLTRPLLAL